jgi:hypothetical protein
MNQQFHRKPVPEFLGIEYLREYTRVLSVFLDNLQRAIDTDTGIQNIDIVNNTTNIDTLFADVSALQSTSTSGIPFPDTTNTIEITEANYDAANAYQLLEADSGKLVQLQDTEYVSYAAWYFKLPHNPAHGTYYWIKQGGGVSSVVNVPYLHGQLYASADPIVAILYNSTPRVDFSDNGTVPAIVLADRMLLCYMYIKESHVFYNGATNKTCVGYWVPVIGTIG